MAIVLAFPLRATIPRLIKKVNPEQLCDPSA